MADRNEVDVGAENSSAAEAHFLFQFNLARASLPALGGADCSPRPHILVTGFDELSLDEVLAPAVETAVEVWAENLWLGM